MPGALARAARRIFRRGRLGGMYGVLEQPGHDEIVSPARVEVVGWAASGAGPAAAVVVRAGRVTVDAELGLSRRDVAAAYRQVPDAERAGWRAVLDLSDLAGSGVEIVVSARAGGGGETELGRVGVRFPTETRLVAGQIDQPRPGEEVKADVLHVYGWAITERAPVARVHVTVAGEPVGQARLGVMRRDVSGALGRRDALMAGFEHHVDVNEIRERGREPTVAVTVDTTDGARFDLGPVPFTVGPVPTADVDAARLTDLRARVAAAVPHRDRAAPRAAHVLVVTHELTLGGGQLYLYELLRRLVPLLPDAEWSLVGSRDGPLVAEYEQLGITVHVQGEMPFWQAAAYEGRLEETAAWTAAHPPDVVLANALVSFPGIDLAGRLGVPAIWAIHESYPLREYFWTMDPGRRVSPAVLDRAEAAFASAAAVVFEADATRALFQRYGEPDRFQVVAYGIDLAAIDTYRAGFERGRARAAHDFAPDATVLLCMGTIEARKSQTLLVRAFEAVAPRHPDAVLVLVGDRGDEHPTHLRDYVAGSAVAGRIRILPIVSDTYEWYGLADALVSASDIESLPRSVLEAMAFDLPVIAADAFGVPELLADESTGYVFVQRDLDALIDALDRFLSDSTEARGTIASAASEHVRAYHDSAHYAAVYRDLINKLLARRL
jgi:D-inositol-3-phosphate glycosyltransferase